MQNSSIKHLKTEYRYRWKKDHAPGPSWLNPRDAGMLEAPTQATRQKKEIKGIKRGKKSNNSNLKMTWLDRKVPKTLPNTLETTVSTTWQDTELTCRYILFLWTDNKHKEKNHRHTLQHSQRKEKPNQESERPSHWKF